MRNIHDFFIFRIMLLNLLNLFSLIIALFKKIYSMNDELDDLRHCKGMQENVTNSTGVSNDTITANGINDLHDLSYPNSMSSAAPFAEATAIYSILHAAINDLFPNIIPKVATIATAFNSNVKNLKKCIRVPVNCSKTSMNSTTKTLITLLALNFTTTILPEITNQLNGGIDFGSSTLTPYTTDMDIFPSSGSTFFDGSSTNFDNDTMEDANSTYPMGTTTTTMATFPFESVKMVNDYEATKPPTDYNDYDGEESYADGKFVVAI